MNLLPTEPTERLRVKFLSLPVAAVAWALLLALLRVPEELVGWLFIPAYALLAIFVPPALLVVPLAFGAFALAMAWDSVLPIWIGAMLMAAVVWGWAHLLAWLWTKRRDRA